MRLSSKNELERFAQRLVEEEFYDVLEGFCRFRNGGYCTTCTDSAHRFVQRFGGVVMGYYALDNPTAEVGRTLVDGHDFALIDRRWLVDYWSWNVARLIATPIFDLTRASDRNKVLMLYGPSSYWSTVELSK